MDLNTLEENQLISYSFGKDLKFLVLPSCFSVRQAGCLLLSLSIYRYMNCKDIKNRISSP